MNSKGILNELRKEIDEIKQKPLSRQEVYIMSLDEKYQLDNKMLCLQEENESLQTKIESLQSENKKLKRERAEAQQMAISLALGQDIQTFEKCEKLKKVIEILNKYFGLMEYEEFEEYKIFTNDGYFVLEITKEEFELLKEYFSKC